MPDSIDLAGFATTATDYAHDNKLHLHTKLLAPGLNGIPGSPIKPLDSYVQGIPTKDRVLLYDFKIGDVLQPDKREGFTPTNNVLKFKNRWANVEEAKINLRFTEKSLVALQNSFLGMLATPNTAKLILDKFPVFEAFVIDKILEKAKVEMRNRVVFNGVLNPALATPQSIFNGWLKIIDDLIISGDIPAGNIAAINAITAANAVTEHLKIVDLLPAEYFYSGTVVSLCAPEHMKNYNKHYQTSRGNIVYNTEFMKQYIEGTNIEMIVEPGLTGTESPILTTRDNLVMLYDADYESMTLSFDYNKRAEDLAYILKFQAAVNLIDPSEIWMGNV